ncbi:hypothetical protein M430DRAFT_54213 [Amorphotheca resinae ATCC 22711]|uniref:MARVEL domain-containing protein n=1 Tax=Amorphotheca resinae ATCC 22711 TaxID=857342 RepID=A0A2T3APJ1_AMORE|nr:hypothetical protein M430DRAFT_54213 [Amorphotheca resinae ATCC 22711]PSS06916.1 hypothetical protein M430DRAFT_54213 [Amorphotheca resinae ATCC 22711]
MTEMAVRVRTKYHWPAVQLNFWTLIMLVGSSANLGIFASFMSVQSQLQLGIPWYFPYWVTVGALSIVFIIIMLWLISQRQLLPGIVIMGSFILFVLWTVGLIVISIQLWGPSGVNGNCGLYVNSNAVKGASTSTLAWLEQHSICQSWTAAWAFELVGAIFLLWMMIMSYQVYRDI